MKTPNWATVIGIIMIVFGGCGAMNDFKSISMPESMAEERIKIKERIAEEKEEDKTTDKDEDEEQSENDSTVIADGGTDSTKAKSEDHEFSIPLFGKQSPEKMLDLSEFTETWIVRFGYVGVIVSIIYLLGGVFLLIRKTFSIKLVYAALVLSILCSGIQTAVLTSNASGDFLGVTLGLTQIPGIIIDIILLAVVFASEKDAYKLENLSQ